MAGSWLGVEPAEGLGEAPELFELPPPKTDSKPCTTPFQACWTWVKKLGAELGRVLPELLALDAAGVAMVALLGSGLTCLAVTTRRRSEVPGGEQVMSVRVGVGVGLSTATSVGSTIWLPVTW